ncbi:MAG: UTP--glucose-1-phosphate uridylyltransferase [Thermodesulfatator sp.]|nr:MAG: UTP--glucose-1-phosphate uridylyltransferase [Thermodesulfatator sp.]
MLPATKVIPKEMLCVVDRPAIQYVVEEAVEAGLSEIIFVISRGKEAILDHFDLSPELETELEARKKTALLEKVRRVSALVESLSAVRQKKALGLGHAVLTAAPLVGKEPFAVLLGDDLVQAEVPCIKQLADKALELKASVVAVERLPREKVSLYGVISGEDLGGGLWRVQGVVEKPRPEEAPSELAIIGRYVFFPEIFEYLRRIPRGAGGEYQLTDAVAAMIADGRPVYALEFQGTRFDTGNKLGFVKTILAYALRDPEIGEELRRYLREDLALL